jgi:hypothetical protein
MHTTQLLSSDDFAFIQDGQPVPMSDLVPGLTVLDRLGVVMRGPADGVGASNLLLACVTAFYDLHRAAGEPFFAYPDYFTFQATPHPARYSSLDIWPPHKNVQVPPDPEQVLHAVNDRGVTLLLVPEGPAAERPLEKSSLSSARRRIRACYVYSPDGRVRAPDFSVRRPAGVVEPYIRKVFESIQDGEMRQKLLTGWEKRQEADGAEETYRRVSLEEALAFLSFDSN